MFEKGIESENSKHTHLAHLQCQIRATIPSSSSSSVLRQRSTGADRMRPIKLVFCALMGGGGVAACHRKHQTKVKLRWLHLPQPSDQLRFSMPQNLPDVTTVVVNLPRSNLCIDHLSVSLTNTTLHIFAIPNMLTTANNLIRIVSITALCLFQAFLVSGLSPLFHLSSPSEGPSPLPALSVPFSPPPTGRPLPNWC